MFQLKSSGQTQASYQLLQVLGGRAVLLLVPLDLGRFRFESQEGREASEGVRTVRPSTSSPSAHCALQPACVEPETTREFILAPRVEISLGARVPS